MTAADLAAIEHDTFVVARNLGHLRLEMAHELFILARRYRERAGEAFRDAEAAARRYAKAIDAAGGDPFDANTPKIIAVLEGRDEELEAAQ